MDFQLSEEHQMLRDTLRDFAVREVAPIIAPTEKEEVFPRACFAKLGQLGITGISIPEEYGGSGGDELTLAVALEELARAWPSLSTILAAHICLCTKPILKYGAEGQKKAFIPPLARGDKVGAFGATEPDSGSDILAARTVAIKDGDTYILNGVKTFITNGPACDTAVVLAVTDKSKGVRGLTTFIVDKGTPGFSVGSVMDKMGMRGAPTSELVFEDCRIAAANRLGEEGQGAAVILSTLDKGRIGIAAQGVGIISGVLDGCVARARERRQFGRPVADFQAIQWMLADMSTQLAASRLLTYQAAWLASQGQPFATESAQAKLFASESAMQAATKGIQIFGGYGYVSESPMQRYFRDAKLTEIYEGTSEIQRIVISRALLKPDKAH